MEDKKIIETYFVPGFFDQCSGLPIKSNQNSKGDGLYGYWIARLKGTHGPGYWERGETEIGAAKNLIASLHFMEYELEKLVSTQKSKK